MDTPASIHPKATGISYQASFNVINSYNNVRHADEKPQVLEWLWSLEPRVRHQDVRADRAEGVGQWLLQNEEFVNWRDGQGESDRPVLFCSGAPGVGKTYLSSLVIDRLCDRSVGQKVGVTCFYCDFQIQKIQTPENILGALLKQIIRGLGVIPREIDDAFQKAKRQVGGRGLLVAELLPLLHVAIAPLERAFICIDALDECLGKHLPELLRSLYTISRWSPKIRLFITGRPHIHREVSKHFPKGTRLVQIKPTMEDITKYLQIMLNNDPEPEAMSPNLKGEIVKRVSETISDVFLLVSLSIAAILAEGTVYDRREQLKRMTNGLGLGNAYRVALGRMGAQAGANLRLGMAALMWVSQSKRAMTAAELCHAIGARVGSTDLNPESVPSIQTLLASCLGLITIDKIGSTVRLVHFTLQEYLDNHPEIFQSPHATMAEVCLTYLNYDGVSKLSPSLDSTPATTPLLEYAATYWGPYARSGTTECVKSLALRLLTDFDSHIASKFLLRRHVEQLTYKPGSQPKGFTGLHCAAYFGIDEIASALLQVNRGAINTADFLGRTPLIWAAKNGCEGIVKLFLKQKDINLTIKDSQWGRTALSWAALGGYEEIVRLLLEQEEVDVESRDNFGGTPHSHAVEGGNEGTVKLFLEREEVNAELRDNVGRTLLSHAAAWGNVRIVKLLMEHEGVNPESRDAGGRTPLSHAASWASVGVVRFFLEREEVNAESQDHYGRTPLSHAIGRGDAATVKLFMGSKKVNPELRDADGRTPLSHAAWLGKVEIVRLVLERGEVNVDSKDNYGRTPLSYAAQSGNEGVMELLLELEGVDTGSQDHCGRTPLSYAAQWQSEERVKLLLDRGGINAESGDRDGRTPLSYAAEWGRVEIAKMFLEREEVNAESRDNRGRTPLSYATEWGRVGVVKLLLDWEEVNAEFQDNEGMTPLFYSLRNRSEEIRKTLLELLGVDPQSEALHEDEGVAQHPLEHPDTLPITQHNKARAVNNCDNSDERESGSLVQGSPQPLETNTNTSQHCAQLSSLVTPLMGSLCQHPETSAQGPKVELETPLTSPLGQPIPPPIVPVGCLEPLPQPPRRRFSQAFEDKPSAPITSKRKKSF